MMKDNRKKIFLKKNRQLYFSSVDKEVEVDIVPCFPWSKPDSYLSLVDDKGKEVDFIENIDDLNDINAKAIREYLAEANFILDIALINNISDEIDLRQYDVETIHGARTFFTKLDDWPAVKENGIILIEDLSGDIFRIKSANDLDKKSQKMINSYLNI